MRTVPIYLQPAVLLQSLYLINLLAAPLLTLIPIVYLCRKNWHSPDPVASCHTRQVAAVTIWFGIVFFGGILLFWLLGNNSPEHWTVLLMYLIVFHTTFVMIGMVGLARALSGKTYRPYLIGVPWEETSDNLDA